MARPNKLHHVVPATYLEAFAIPAKRKGSLWVMNRDLKIYPGTPQSVLTDTDFYQVRKRDGMSTLAVENRFLSMIEGVYSNLYKNKITKFIPLNESDKTELAIFTASMIARAPSLRDAQADFYRRVTDHIDAIDALSDEQKQHIAETSVPIPDSDDVVPGHVIKDIAKDVASHHTEGIPQLVQDIVPYFLAMHCGFLVSVSPDHKFITSDSPCVMVNPEAEKRHGRKSMMSNAGLAQKDVEVSLPLSPKITAIWGWKMIADGHYAPLDSDYSARVADINSRTLRHARKVVSGEKQHLETIKAKIKKRKG